MRLIFVSLVSSLLFLGWFISAVIADVGCSHGPPSSEPCTEETSSFAIMLPFVSGNVSSNVAQPGENPQDLPTAITPPATSEGTPVATSVPSPTSALATTPSAPTSSIPPTAKPTSSATDGPPATATASMDPTATSTSIPGPNQSPTPILPLLSDPPVVSALVQQRNALSIAWSGCGSATSARVLFGLAESRPNEMSTTARSLVTPNLAEAGVYQVIVECYDELGNSVFSAPTMAEVSSQAVTK